MLKQNNFNSVTHFPKINICAQKFNRNKLVAIKDTNQYAEWTHQIPAINAKPGGQYYAAYFGETYMLDHTTLGDDQITPAYLAFNLDNTNTASYKFGKCELIYYSPVKLKLNKLICNLANTTSFIFAECAKRYTIYGSADGNTWDKLKYYDSLPPTYYNFFKYDQIDSNNEYRNDTFIINIEANNAYQYVQIVGDIGEDNSARTRPYVRIVFPKIKLDAKQLVEKDTPEYSYWAMPSLTENGIIGESDYAVTAEPTTITYANKEIFKSFDNTAGGDKTYCCLSGQMAEASLIWYSKNKLKFNAIKFKNPSKLTATDFPSKINLFGSIDNKNWVNLAKNIKYNSTATNAEQTIFIIPELYSVNQPGFNYLKISMTNLNNDATKYCSFPEITIFADEYTGKNISPVIPEKLGGIKLVDFIEYNDIQNKYNYCAAFGIDIKNNKLRLPDYRNAFLMGATNTNIGQTIQPGLPDLNGAFGAGSNLYSSGDATVRWSLR